MVTRLQQHLVDAHNFTADTWRLDNADREHLRDHAFGNFMHFDDDLYLAIDEDGPTDDPDEVLDADPA